MSIRKPDDYNGHCGEATEVADVAISGTEVAAFYDPIDMVPLTFFDVK